MSIMNFVSEIKENEERRNQTICNLTAFKVFADRDKCYAHPLNK